MANYGIYDDLLLEDEEKKKERYGIYSDLPRTPSQKAGQEQKEKTGILEKGKQVVQKTAQWLKDWWTPEEAPAGKEPVVQLQEQQVTADDVLLDVVRRNNNVRTNIVKTEKELIEEYLQEVKKHPQLLYENRPVVSGLAQMTTREEVEGTKRLVQTSDDNTLREIISRRLRENNFQTTSTGDFGSAFESKRIKELREQYNFQTKEQQMYMEIINKGTNDGDFREGLIEGIKSVPVVTDIKNVMNTYQVYNALRKRQNNEPLTKTEEAALNTKEAEQIEMMLDPKGGGYSLGYILGQMPYFAATFGITKGIAKYVGSKALGLRPIANLAIKHPLLAKTITSLIGVSAQTGIGFMPQIVSKSSEYTVDNWEFAMSEEGSLLITTLEEDRSFEEALVRNLPKGYAYTWTEVASEYGGEVLNYAKRGLIIKYIGKHADKPISEVARMMKQIGWDGIINEIIEEELAAPAQALIEGQQYDLPILTEEGNKRLLLSALSVGIFGTVATGTASVESKARYDAAVNRLRTQAKEQGYSEEQINQLVEDFDRISKSMGEEEGVERAAPETLEASREEGVETPMAEEIPQEIPTRIETREGVVVETAQEPRTGGEFTVVNDLVNKGLTDINFERVPTKEAVNISAEGVPTMTIQETPDTLTVANVPQDIGDLLREYAREANKELITVESSDQISRPEARKPAGEAAAKATTQRGVAQKQEPTLREIIEPFTVGGRFVAANVPSQQVVNVARQLGRASFFEGRSVAPAQSPEMMEMIRSIQDSGQRQAAMRAYSDAWTDANLSQPLEGKYKEGTKFRNEAGESVEVLGTDNLGRYRVQITDKSGNVRTALVSESQLEAMRRVRGKAKKTKTQKELIQRRESNKIKKKAKFHEKGKAMEQANLEYITREEALNIVRKYFNGDEVDVTFAEKILTDEGLEAFGKYSEAMITFVNNPSSSTPEHEVVHAFLDLFTTSKRKAEILSQIKNKYNLKTDLAAEEKIADDFVNYVRNQQSKPFLKKLYDKVINFVRGFFGDVDAATQLYEDILAKKRETSKRNESERKEYFKKIAEKYKYTTKTLTAMENDIESGQLSPLASRQTLESYMRRKGVTKADTEIFNRTMAEYDQDPINTFEFMNSMRAKIMPLELKQSTTYQQYGLQNLVNFTDTSVGNMSVDEMGTHLWNSNFIYPPSGHFEKDFTGESRENLTITERTDPETGKTWFFVLDKRIPLTQETAAEAALYAAPTREEAQSWLERISTIQEGEGDPFGLFAHSRFITNKYTTNGRKILRLENDIRKLRSSINTKEYHVEQIGFIVENMDLNKKFYKDIKSWGENKLKDKKIFKELGDSETGKYTIRPTLGDLFVIDDIVNNDSKEWSNIKDADRDILNKWYISKIKEITGVDYPAAKEGVEYEYDALSPSKFSRTIYFSENGNLDWETTRRNLVDFDHYVQMEKPRGESLQEAKNRLETTRKGNEKDIKNIQDEIKELKKQDTSKDFVPEYTVVEVQSDPMQTSYPAETEWNLSRIQLNLAKSRLNFLNNKDKSPSEKKELLTKDYNHYPRARHSYGRSFYDTQVNNDSSMWEDWFNQTKSELEAAIDELQVKVDSAAERLTPLEKQFFAVGSKWYERVVDEEINFAVEQLKEGEKVRVMFPTVFTVGVVEGFSTKDKGYTITQNGVERVKTSSKEADFIIPNGINNPIFSDYRDLLNQIMEGTDDNGMIYVQIDDKFYLVQAVDPNGTLKLVNIDIEKERNKYEYITLHGVNKEGNRIVEDLKEGDIVELDTDKYWYVKEIKNNNVMFRRGGTREGQYNSSTLEVPLDKLEEALDTQIVPADEGRFISLNEWLFEIQDVKDGKVILKDHDMEKGESDEIMPYEWNNSRDPEVGETIEYGGETYMVISVDGNSFVANPDRHTWLNNISDDVESFSTEDTQEAIRMFDEAYADGLTPQEAREEEYDEDWMIMKVIDSIGEQAEERKYTGDDVYDEVYEKLYESNYESFDPREWWGDDEIYPLNDNEYYRIENPNEKETFNMPDYYNIGEVFAGSDLGIKDIVPIKYIDYQDITVIPDVVTKREDLDLEEEEVEVPKFNPDGTYVWNYEKDLRGDDAQLAVLRFVERDLEPTVKKKLKNATLYTNPQGLQWWSGIYTYEDKQNIKPIEVYQLKPEELQPKKKKITKTAQRMAEKPTVKEVSEAFFLARMPETELRVRSIQPARTPEELKQKIDQLNKFAQSNAILRYTGKVKAGAAGQFSYGVTRGIAPEGEVRLKDRYIQDDAEYLAVLAHELGHALEFNLTGSTITSTYKVFSDSLTEEQISTVTKELKDVTKSLVGEAEVARKPIYYNKRTELLARFLEKMVLAPAELEELAPTAVSLFEQNMVRHPLMMEYMEAAHDMIDKKAFKPVLPDLRTMYQKHLGKRVGNIAYDREIVHRAMQERAKYVLEKFVKNKFKNVKDAPETLFRAAEAIKITRNGNPVFGTRDYIKAKNEAEEETLILSGWEKVDEQIEDGIKVPVYARQRYTAQEGQNIYNSLSEEGKQLIKDFTAARDEARDFFNRELIKDIYKIGGDIEGWVFHYFEEKPSGIISKTLKFRKKKAGTRFKRTGKEGYVEDLQKAMTKALIDLEGEKEFNKFITSMFATTTKPIREGEEPDAGWVEVVGTLQKGVGTPSEKRLVIVQDGKSFKAKQTRYQMPKEIYDRYQLIRGLVEEASTATRIVNSLNRYWRINILTHGGTAATNFISGGVQYSAKILTDFYTEVLTGNTEMKQTKKNVSALLKVLTPKGWTEKSPDWVYGGDLSNYYGQFMSANNKSRFDRTLDSYADKALKMFSTTERYWKKVISLAENVESLERLNKVGKEGLPELTKEEEKLIAALNREVDLYAYDYDNVPLWLEHHQKSPAGQAVKPFAKYPYKYAQQVTQMVGSVFDGSLSWQERAAKLLTLTTIAAAYAAFSDDRKKQQETPEGDENVPARLRTQGRVFVTKDEEGNELFLRVSKYPFVNLTEAGIQLVNGNFETSKDVMSDMLGSIAPIGDSALLLFNYRNTYDVYTPVPVVLAEQVSTFVPFSRLLNDVSRMLDPFRRKEEAAYQAFTRLIPTTDEDLQKLLHGSVRTERVPLEGEVEKRVGEGTKRTTTDRELKQYWQDILLSMFTGLYVTRINPEYAKAYQIRAEKNAENTEEELSDWEKYLKSREENGGN